MKLTQRAAALLPALFMICGLLTAPALAAEPQPDPCPEETDPPAAIEWPMPEETTAPAEGTDPVEPEPAPEPDYIAACDTKSNGRPYYIMVDRRQNVVTVYGLDAEEYYTVPVKAMLCSTGAEGDETPVGTFSITTYRRPWNKMIDGSYGQYAVQFWGNYLFHSVCYAQPDPSTLFAEQYGDLGRSVSHGCVRLQNMDAKWIYENCAAGTLVTIYDGYAPAPLGKPEPAVPCISPEEDNGWDPTDDRSENPWLQRIQPAEPDPAEPEPEPDPDPEPEPEPDPQPEPQSSERRYIIQRGDTLGAIAKRFYGDVMRYRDIFEHNRSILQSPDLIYAGQVIVLPELE